MLRSIKDLEGFAVGATDGTIGHVKDFYFDDRAWIVRYLVVDAGAWLSSRKVLISPISIGRPDWAERLLHVSITKEQVRQSPDIDTDKPVSRQHEMQFSGYYGYPYYWGGSGYWGGGMYPNMMLPGCGGFGSPRGRARLLPSRIGWRRSSPAQLPGGHEISHSCFRWRHRPCRRPAGRRRDVGHSLHRRRHE